MAERSEAANAKLCVKNKILTFSFATLSHLKCSISIEMKVYKELVKLNGRVNPKIQRTQYLESLFVLLTLFLTLIIFCFLVHEFKAANQELFLLNNSNDSTQNSCSRANSTKNSAFVNIGRAPKFSLLKFTLLAC